MSDEWKAYVEDIRTVCKYGAKCYQKNSDHLKTFKHPPLLKRTNRTQHYHQASKRFKPVQSNNPDTRVKNNKANPEEDKMDSNVGSEVESSANRTEMNHCPDIMNSITLPEDLTYYDKETNRDTLKELFLVEMPPDFYKFYECLLEDGASAEKTLDSVNLQLIGPYDLLLGKLPILTDKELYLVHWRFFYDPPEFQAVLKTKGKSQFHVGYFRDDPNEQPVFLAINNSEKDCHITPMAENIFGAVYKCLQNEKKRSPFTAMACQKLIEKIKTWSEKYNYSLEEYNMKMRLSKIITKTFHTAGIVVPVDKKTEIGYRKLVESDANIKKLFKKLETAKSQEQKDEILSDLQPVITYANIAVDECDFGTGLELGINLFCSGLKELEPSALSSLCASYSLLNRDAFIKIIKAHLKYRRKGADMSVISKK